MNQKKSTMHRRQFLTTGLRFAAGFACLQAVPVWAGTQPRTLSFFHTHTNEQLDITYARAGMYDPRALHRMNYYLRDFRTGEVHVIDPKVFDLLWKIQGSMGSKGRYEVISGYRSPATNQALRSKSSKVAKHSLHMEGRAIDIRLTSQKTCQLRDCAIALKCGGVGYYAKSDFVHVDTGRVRTW
jgi:uncharacterized protein YcbK (DUF882 family)